MHEVVATLSLIVAVFFWSVAFVCVFAVGILITDTSINKCVYATSVMNTKRRESLCYKVPLLEIQMLQNERELARADWSIPKQIMGY